jgi:hypothetical protein
MVVYLGRRLAHSALDWLFSSLVHRFYMALRIGPMTKDVLPAN